MRQQYVRNKHLKHYRASSFEKLEIQKRFRRAKENYKHIKAKLFNQKILQSKDVLFQTMVKEESKERSDHNNKYYNQNNYIIYISALLRLCYNYIMCFIGIELLSVQLVRGQITI